VVIPVITALGIAASLGQSVQEFRHVDWRVLRGLALPTGAGVALGLWLFAFVDQQLLLKSFGAFIIGYGLWGFLPRRPGASLSPTALAGAAGVSGGLVATLFGGMAGPFYAMYLRVLELDKRRFRASMSSVLLCLGLVRAGDGARHARRRPLARAPRPGALRENRRRAARAERLRAAVQVAGGAPSPGPSGRCISTVSTQRPNL